MKSAATISLVFSAFAFQGVAAVTLVQPVPTSVPSFSIPSFTLPSGVTIPSFSIPTSFPTSALSTPSVTAFATVSVGGVASDGATTYFLQEVEGVNGVTTTVTETIVQGATVWREDALQETCSLDGKGGAVCVLGVGEFETSFTGTAVPLFTVGAKAAGAGGGGGSGGSAAGSGSGGAQSTGSAPNGAARANGGASVGWMFVVTAAAMVAGMKLIL